jgi:hypothetical protein
MHGDVDPLPLDQGAIGRNRDSRADGQDGRGDERFDQRYSALVTTG